MKDTLNTEALRQLLNRSLSQMDDDTLARLRNARAHALQHYTPQHAPLALLNLAAHRLGHTLKHPSPQRLTLWFGALLLMTMFASITYTQLADDTSDLDIEILTDDMPVDVYVD